MQDYKKDFPIFQNHPDLVYLDSTATSQKPTVVIDGVADYLRNSYANIHRGSYVISEISERLYEDSKKIVAKNLGVENWREVIYTANSTYALNILAQSIWRTGLLKAGDTVLLSIVEHHANVVPWLILKEDYGVNVEFVGVTDNFDLDYNDFRDKLTDKVKIVSLTHVSNTTGQIFDIENVSSLLAVRYGNNKPLFIVDASQSVPHFEVDVLKLGCDALFFTGHKIFADSGIGVLWAKETLLNVLNPIFSGGGAIESVSESGFTHSKKLPDKFEPGTPNLSGAVSLLRAFEYLDSIGGYRLLENHERELVHYSLEKFAGLESVKLIGSTASKNRVGVFTFVVEGIHSFDISDYLADNDICVRAGQHCAEPLMDFVGQKHSCRMSIQVYNTKEDIDAFFEVLEKAIKELA
ncbi:aminotransferase class V-fold PLP-dependent enzyme [Candidatus Gracilibacteria bacterium]|nr:aminotransferase class V-fold PLP-dependent enzyme [Candidatus Gracilibacteria bacterium]